MKKKIYVAEDNPGAQDLFQIILEKAGYDVVVDETGNAIISNNYIKPNIFILDRHLSVLDGLDICRHLKSSEPTKNIPVIIVSATPDLPRLAKNAGADDYLQKPFRLKELMAMVKKYA